MQTQIQLHNTSENYMKTEAPICSNNIEIDDYKDTLLKIIPRFYLAGLKV